MNVVVDEISIEHGASSETAPLAAVEAAVISLVLRD